MVNARNKIHEVDIGCKISSVIIDPQEREKFAHMSATVSFSSFSLNTIKGSAIVVLSIM